MIPGVSVTTDTHGFQGFYNVLLQVLFLRVVSQLIIYLHLTLSAAFCHTKHVLLHPYIFSVVFLFSSSASFVQLDHFLSSSKHHRSKPFQPCIPNFVSKPPNLSPWCTNLTFSTVVSHNENLNTSGLASCLSVSATVTTHHIRSHQHSVWYDSLTLGVAGFSPHSPLRLCAILAVSSISASVGHARL